MRFLLALKPADLCAVLQEFLPGGPGKEIHPVLSGHDSYSWQAVGLVKLMKTKHVKIDSLSAEQLYSMACRSRQRM